MDAIATFPTAHAARHLTAMCKHFARKVPATFDERSGFVAFPFGRCDMTADAESLRLVATAADKRQLDEVVEVITRHLERFAFRENPNLTWQPTEKQTHPRQRG